MIISKLLRKCLAGIEVKRLKITFVLSFMAIQVLSASNAGATVLNSFTCWQPDVQGQVNVGRDGDRVSIAGGWGKR